MERSAVACAPSSSSYYSDAEREACESGSDNNDADDYDTNTSAHHVKRSIRRHNIRPICDSAPPDCLRLTPTDDVARRGATRKAAARSRRNHFTTFATLRLSPRALFASSLWLSALMLVLMTSRALADCGCGSRCENYTEDVQCTRCCTATVRRSISPDNYPSMSRFDEETRKDPIKWELLKNVNANDGSVTSNDQHIPLPVRPMQALNVKGNDETPTAEQHGRISRLFDVKTIRPIGDERATKTYASSSSADAALSVLPAASPLMMANYYRNHLLASARRRAAEDNHSDDGGGMSRNNVARIVEQLQRREQLDNYLKLHKQLRIRKHLYNSVYRYLNFQRDAKNMK